MDYSMMMDFKKMFVGKMFEPKSDCPTCRYFGKDKSFCRNCLERNRVKFAEPTLFT